jgi:hypothetical protein
MRSKKEFNAEDAESAEFAEEEAERRAIRENGVPEWPTWRVGRYI